MAKVHNQVFFGDEELYTDADGRAHYFGEFFRHIITEAYPLPSLNPSGVSRKTPRGYRPTQQGGGSAAQTPFRMCFSQCAERWDALTDECPTVPSCEKSSSKKSIWDEKQGQGVPCSYYDLYMRCCLSSCTEISITGPGGGGITGGAISADENCFRCPYAGEGGVSIQAVSTTVPCGGQAQLHIDPEDFPLPWYFAIISGGGSVSGNGLYMAPDSNLNCVDNPVIGLYICEELAATVTLGVNCHHTADQAWHERQGECFQVEDPGNIDLCGEEVNEGITLVWAANCWSTVACDDSFLAHGYNTFCQGNDPGDCYGTLFCSMVQQPAIARTDDRTEAMKELGCCPAGLA